MLSPLPVPCSRLLVEIAACGATILVSDETSSKIRSFRYVSITDDRSRYIGRTSWSAIFRERYI